MKAWLRRFKKFFSYPVAEQAVVVEAFWVVLLVRLGLKLLSFQRFRQVYASLLQSTSVRDVPSALIERYVWAIERVSGSLSAVCLPQALALKFFLRNDKATEIVIGIEKNQGFNAHARVEKNGRILIGDLPQMNFQPIWKWQ
ncbi:lasso peptide biosynthesis B2 protein [Spirosoma koreense]